MKTVRKCGLSDEGVPHMPVQGSVHNVKRAPRQTLGTQTRRRSCADAARSEPKSHACSPRNRRASVRHAEDSDGYTHFLTKRLPNVATELSLIVLAYNLTRVKDSFLLSPPPRDGGEGGPFKRAKRKALQWCNASLRREPAFYVMYPRSGCEFRRSLLHIGSHVGGDDALFFDRCRG